MGFQASNGSNRRCLHKKQPTLPGWTRQTRTNSIWILENLHWANTHLLSKPRWLVTAKFPDIEWVRFLCMTFRLASSLTKIANTNHSLMITPKKNSISQRIIEVFMSYFESPYLKELTIYRNINRHPSRNKRALANLSLLKDKFSEGRPTLLMDNSSTVSCEKYSGKQNSTNACRNVMQRIQARMDQFESLARRECEDLKNDDRNIGESLLQCTYQVYRSKLDCARLQRYLSDLEREYDEEKEVYDSMIINFEGQEQEQEKDQGEGWSQQAREADEADPDMHLMGQDLSSRQCSSEKA